MKRTAAESGLLFVAGAAKQPRVSVVADQTPRERLKDFVVELVARRAESDFPRQCADCFDEVIRPFLDRHSRKDTLLLPQMRGPGKMLVHVLQLAVAYVNHGAAALDRAREQLDSARVNENRLKTRNWFAVARDLVSHKHELFNDIKTTTWTDVKASVHPPFEPAPLDDDDDDDSYSYTGSLTDEVVDCFSAAHDLVSMTSGDMYAAGWDEYQTGFRCDLCERDYDPMEFQFYRCETCLVDYCPGCANRQENFT